MTATDQPTVGVALKPCPFCGGRAHMEFGEFELDAGFHVVCHGDKNCPLYCSQPYRVHDAEADAVRVWNTRTPASGPVEADDRLAVAVEAVLDLAAKAVEDHQREGREWVPGSLWDDITRQAAGRIRAIKPQALALLTKSGEAGE